MCAYNNYLINAFIFRILRLGLNLKIKSYNKKRNNEFFIYVFLRIFVFYVQSNCLIV